MRKATEVLRLLSGLALGLALTAAVATAQQPAAQPSPGPQKSADAKSQSSTTKASEESDYNVTSSIEIGDRGLRVDGDVNKYQSDLNYKAGVRLFDTSLLMRAKEGTKAVIDDLLVTSTGWGADPYGHVRVSAENSKWFRFDGQYRRFKYFNYLNNLANPNFASANGAVVIAPKATGLHGYDVRQQIGDFDLTILPKNRNFSFVAGYSPERYNGLTMTTYHAGGGELLLPANTRSNVNDFHVGANFRLGPVDFSLLQGWRRLDENSVIDVNYLNSNYAATALTNLVSTTDFAREQPVKGSTDYTRFNAHTLLARKLDMTGSFIYSNSNTSFNLLETIAGVNWNTRVTGAPTTNTLNGGTITYVGDTKRPNVVGNFGATFLATGKLRLSNTVRFESFHINGSTFYTSVFDLTRTNGTAYPTISATGTLGTSKVTSFRKMTDTVEGDYQFNDRYSAHFGYRYGTRRETVFYDGYNPGAYLPARVTPDSEIEENQTNVFFGGFKARPVKTWTVYFGTEHGNADNIFTRVGEYNYTNFRVRSRYTPSRKLALNLTLVTKDNSDPTTVDGVSIADFGVSTKSRVFTSSVDFAPSSRLSFSGGYNYNWVNGDTIIKYAYAVPPATTAQGAITGHSLYYVRNNFFFLDTVAEIAPRLTFYAAYRINQDNGQGGLLSDPAGGRLITSYPMSYQSPEARIALRINRRLDANFGYAYYNYNESKLDAFVGVGRAQNHHAHQPYVSVRFYFGNRTQ